MKISDSVSPWSITLVPCLQLSVVPLLPGLSQPLSPFAVHFTIPLSNLSLVSLSVMTLWDLPFGLSWRQVAFVVFLSSGTRVSHWDHSQIINHSDVSQVPHHTWSQPIRPMDLCMSTLSALSELVLLHQGTLSSITWVRVEMKVNSVNAIMSHRVPTEQRALPKLFQRDLSPHSQLLGARN